MRATTIAVSLIFVSYLVSFADEPKSAGDSKQVIEKLLRRIDQLEQRVSALESRSSQPQPDPFQPTQPYQPQTPQPSPTQPYLPQPPNRLTPTVPSYTPAPPVTPYNTPSTPPAGSVPKKWQRFEFNGQQFYIVPVDQF